MELFNTTQEPGKLTKEQLLDKAEKLRADAEAAKKAQQFEFAFLLYDQADSLENVAATR